jgi:uncharacterized oxidoreductase
MPTIQADKLEAVCRLITTARGSAEKEADQVARNLVVANLKGHDSHGVGMLPRYIKSSFVGELNINSHAEIVTDHGLIVQIDGNQGYGQVIGEEAMEIGIERAKAFGLCILTIRNSYHLCRIGAWGEQCAEHGLVSMHHVNGYGHPGYVAPFRGSDARISTNPYCVVLPKTANNPPTVLDFATSAVAQGKIRVAKNKGVEAPEGALINHKGQPTRDPMVLFQEPMGALAAVGGEAAGHKGYGLAFINELFGGVLSGGHTCRPETHHEHDVIINGMLSIIIDPEKMTDRESFEAEIDAAIAHVTASPAADPEKPVLVPGDPERQTLAERRSEGVPIDDETWREILVTGQSVGIEPDELRSLAAVN